MPNEQMSTPFRAGNKPPDPTVNEKQSFLGNSLFRAFQRRRDAIREFEQRN